MSNQRPKVIDVYAGAGGFSLGAARAGFDVVASVEIDPFANETHSRNFPNTKHIGLDVAKLSGSDLLRESELKLGELDGLIGGPPCQGFSTIGHRDPNDARNSLFAHFFRLIAETKPCFFVAENVPGILHKSNEGVLRSAFSLLPENFRLLPPLKICAADYAAPTTRTRVFFVGYDATRINGIKFDGFLSSAGQVPTNVQQAFAGLPEEIDPSWQSEDDGWRPVARLTSSFFNDRAQGHVPSGVGDQFALDAFFDVGYTSGCLGTAHTPVNAARYGNVKPGEHDTVSKSPRLALAGLCPTLRAGTGKDKGSFQAVRPIHPTQPRVITPREAARLQGFPDWFLLHRTKWHSFRQIGNSVSPLVAEAVLARLIRHCA
jgi:DNA (cytosine-5)-methyltransferase 1